MRIWSFIILKGLRGVWSIDRENNLLVSLREGHQNGKYNIEDIVYSEKREPIYRM